MLLVGGRCQFLVLFNIFPTNLKKKNSTQLKVCVAISEIRFSFGEPSEDTQTQTEPHKYPTQTPTVAQTHNCFLFMV